MLFKNTRPLVYFAAPLFSEAELSFNVRLTDILERTVDVYLPQRDGGRLVDLISRGVSPTDAYTSIFQRDMEALRECDALLIVLDGRSIDEGAVFELGVAFASGKPCVGYQSDPRRLLPVGNNPMIACALSQVFENSESLSYWANRLSHCGDQQAQANHN
jgi:nucleoside 2-deoxyribosyltransferase